MFELHKISIDAIPAALEKANQYRLLNEPLQAESICLDILAVDPDNQQALIALLLSLSDQFSSGRSIEMKRARDLLPKLTDDYQQAYYAGILAERRATVLVEQGGAQRGHVAYNLLREAIEWYDKAESDAPSGDDSAILRRNTCIRLIENNPHVTPATDDPTVHMLE